MVSHSEGRPLSFHEELLKIYADPEIRRFAMRRAGHHELAEDAIQETYYSVSRVHNPENIRDIRAFYCRALAHEINRQRSQGTPTPVEDTVLVATAGSDGPFLASSPDRSVETAAILLVLTQIWLKRFQHDRARLQALVAGRSANPDRYRQVVLAAAEQILTAAVASCVSWADSNEALQAAYPSWLNEHDCDADTIYQRRSRARQDVRLLLRSIVTRAELSPLPVRGRPVLVRRLACGQLPLSGADLLSGSRPGGLSSSVDPRRRPT